MQAIFISLFALVSLSAGAAGYNSSVSFSSQEVAQHRARISTLVNVASQCLEDYREEHLDFYYNNCRRVNGRQVCLSKFYGERRYSKSRNAYRADGEPLTYLGDALRSIGFPTSYMNVMENTSCVGMALQCLKEGFYATNQERQWQKVIRFTRANGVGGTALQHALRALGWKIYYWNPNPENVKQWDREERGWASKGYHEYRYRSVMNNGTYWYNRVDNKTALVGFGASEPAVLQNVPFWVGTAHTGYHVFPGSFGNVVEAHSTRSITSVDNLEFSRFAPMATGGGPRWTPTEKYRSGLIALPPQ